MTITNIDYAAALNIKHYIVPMLMSEITLEDAQTAAASGGSALSSWLNVTDAISGQLPVSYAYTGTPAVFTLTIDGDPYPLDGTGAPIQLLNVTSAPQSTETSDETVITHDQVTRGSAITVGVTDTHSFAFAGMTAYKNVDHKVLEVMREVATAERLAVKYLRVGPGGTDEKKLCYGRFSGKSEEGDAGALVKYSVTLNVLGTVFTILDN